MYNIEFYEDANGHSELWDFLEELRLKAATNKDARIQLKQISLYIQLLEDNGTRLNENITKHLDDDIWELRPGNNRVLYFYFKDDTFVLLHQFRKKTQKTLSTLRYRVFSIGAYFEKSNDTLKLKISLIKKRRKWFDSLWDYPINLTNNISNA